MVRNSHMYKTWVEVDAVSLRHNFLALTKHLGKGVAVMAIVKSNAYGHGIVKVIKTIGGFASEYYSEAKPPIVWFGVDSIDEALILKKSGIKNPILILGYVPSAMLVDVVRNNFRVCLYDIPMLKELTRLAKKMRKKVFVHVKLETGTHRQGVMPEDVSAFARALKKSAPQVIVQGAYTHFADTENPKSRYYKEQLLAFQNAIKIFEEEGVRPQYLHTAASAALLLYPEAHFTMARLGIALYGMYPSPEVADKVKKQVALKPALTWKTRVAQVKTIPAGKTIGYDRTYKAQKEMKIAVIPIGYWDGFDCGFSNNGAVLVGGRRVPIVGNICMNICMLDITKLRGVKPGDEVVLLGRQGRECISAEELASRISTINYEITTCINPLIPRIII